MSGFSARYQSAVVCAERRGQPRSVVGSGSCVHVALSGPEAGVTHHRLNGNWIECSHRKRAESVAQVVEAAHSHAGG